jgi:hypothetical protein
MLLRNIIAFANYRTAAVSEAEALDRNLVSIEITSVSTEPKSAAQSESPTAHHPIAFKDV